MNEMTPVELGSHLNRQRTAPQARGGEFGVGCGQDEVAAHADEDPHLALIHRLDDGDGVHAVFARRVDMTNAGQPVQELLGRPVVDAAGAVALNVAVAAHRRRAGALPAEVSAQQHQVDDLADGVDTVFMLGEAQTPTDQGPVGA